MAIKLIANYSKRLGLPGYSSHQFSVSVETELVATGDIPAEAARLYELLQSNVDGQMLRTGFVPPLDYGMDPAAASTPTAANGASSSNGNFSTARNGPPPANGNPNGNTAPLDGRWKCSDKQRDLILKLVDEHQLDKHAVEALAVERFGHGVRLLNKLEASGLIDELLNTHGNGQGNGTATRSSAGRNGSAYRNASTSNPGTARRTAA